MARPPVPCMLDQPWPEATSPLRYDYSPPECLASGSGPQDPVSSLHSQTVAGDSQITPRGACWSLQPCLRASNEARAIQGHNNLGLASSSCLLTKGSLPVAAGEGSG